MSELRGGDLKTREPDRRQFTRREQDTPEDLIVRSSIDSVLAQLQGNKITAQEASDRLMALEKGKRVYDELTGVLSRTTILRELNREMGETRENSGHKVAVVLLDLDHFKDVNDNEPGGHQAGDKTLIELGKIAKELGYSNQFGRLGGEEFLVVLHGADENEIVKKLEEFGNKIGDELAERAGLERHDKVTASMGVAFFDGQESEMELVHRADLMAYQAKGKKVDSMGKEYEDVDGRNRMVVQRPGKSKEIVKFN
jgi:diguanylate cyclase (GGDEF)-like protein